MKHFKVVFEPDGKQISIHANATLLEAASRAGIVLNSVCGGKGICKKCIVDVKPGGKKVLACQYRIESDLTVSIPQTSRFFEQRILEYGIYRQIKIHPTVCKIYIKTKIDTSSVQALESEMNAKSSDNLFRVSRGAFAQLKQFDPQILAKGITAVCYVEPGSDKTKNQPTKYIVESFEQGDTTDRLFGLAIDIGTTTVVAKLIDMITGQCKATQAATNPQTQYGDDVISRIAYAQNDVKLAELNKTIVNCINKLVQQSCEKIYIDTRHIYEICAVGNTSMNHIFLKLPIKQLGQSPYRAYSLEAHDIPADKLGLKINPAGNIHTVENIAGFVGADITAVALAVDIDTASDVTLTIDIGTNGEVVLGTSEKLYAASCAAGPAFEGARITCGSRAVEGAIERVILNENDIDLDVIGNLPAQSICGSGLIDAVAVLLELGIIEPSGRFAESDKVRHKLPKAIFLRIFDKDGRLAFCLAYDDISGQPKVFLSQQDIREVQLAKAAIRAGIKILQKKLGIEDADIMRILLAGAFGSYIRKESALRIGLLPAVPAERIHFVGNAAASGAQMILLSQLCRQKAKELARKIEYIEIAHELDFQTVFADSMTF